MHHGSALTHHLNKNLVQRYVKVQILMLRQLIALSGDKGGQSLSSLSTVSSPSPDDSTEDESSSVVHDEIMGL
jgi:hypothetical protein